LARFLLHQLERLGWLWLRLFLGLGRLSVELAEV
jgi:hypothetical protein